MANSVSISGRRDNGALHILVATAVGGGAGYVLTVFAGVRLGIEYAPFAAFWSGLFLVVSALSGVQQEISRAASERTFDDSSHRRPVARNFGALAALATGGVTLASAPLWIGAVFPRDGWFVVVPLALGVAGYVIVATMAGVFYGLNLWRFVASLMMIDGLLRLVLTGTLLLITTDVRLLAWAVILPFLVAPVIVWFASRKAVVNRFILDVEYGALTWNVARTVIGAAATGVLVSGLPLLIAATSPSEQPVAALMFAINATRAPIVIVVLSLQSYFVVKFRDLGARLLRIVLLLLGAVLVGSGALAALAWWLGPWLLGWIREDFVVDGIVLAGIVASGGLAGALCVTGPAALSRSHHFLSTLGWVVAALITVACLLLPYGLHERVLIAVFAGPLVGLLVHLCTFVLPTGRPPAD